MTVKAADVLCLIADGPMTEWFEEWFGEEYLHLYPHRDEADAGRMVALIRRTLPWRDGWRVLDVGCGAGRHAAALEAAGSRPVGLDLSPSLLRRAREVTDAPLIRADMRWLPVRAGSMDLTVNLFTSFGYFATDQEHEQALCGMARTLRPRGWLVLDFLNADHVREHLVPAGTLDLEGTAVPVRRWVSPDGRYVHKAMDTPERRFTERVRLFTAAELEELLRRAGITVHHRFGGYDGHAHGPGAPRTILMGSRA